MSTHNTCFYGESEAVLMSTHNMCFFVLFVCLFCFVFCLRVFAVTCNRIFVKLANNEDA